MDTTAGACAWMSAAVQPGHPGVALECGSLQFNLPLTDGAYIRISTCYKAETNTYDVPNLHIFKP